MGHRRRPPLSCLLIRDTSDDNRERSHEASPYVAAHRRELLFGTVLETMSLSSEPEVVLGRRFTVVYHRSPFRLRSSDASHVGAPVGTR